MARGTLAVLLAGLAAAALLAIATLTTQTSPSVLFYAPAMPSLAEYTAYASQPGAGVFEYNTVAPASGQTYTYTTTAAPATDTYQYSTTQPPGEFTYTAMPSDDGLTFYNAEETQPQMTVINGYATEGNNMEKWYTMPVGTLHPLDTAGDWDSGAFDSINPDGTARAGAPLTLSGEREDGTVAADARAVRKIGLAPAQMKAARFTQLLQQPAQTNERQIWNTPASQVAQLSRADQRVWAKHVMAQHALHRVWATAEQDVKKLPVKEQREWAEHVVAEAKRHAAEAQGNAKWAHKVEQLLHSQHRIRRALAGSKAKAKPAPLKETFDTFGFANLKGSFAGNKADGLQPQTLASIAQSLRDTRPCDAACQQRALRSATTGMIPIH